MEADLEKLRSLCINNENLEIISKIIDSLHDRQDYARYHYKEYERLLDEKKSAAEVIMLAISPDQNYELHRIAMKANIISCIQNMHIIHDLLGFLILKVLDLKIIRNGEEVKNIYLRTVINELKSINDNRCTSLLNLLIQLAGEDVKNQPLYFDYLCEIVNHSKHKYTIEPKFNTNFTGDIERICYFDNFTHNKKHDKMDAVFFINTEYNREAKLIIEIENELIRILENDKEMEKEESKL
jgi:hypothetical protein